LLDEHADSLDSAVEELGRMVDHLRQVGIRGFIAEHTGDEDFTHLDGHAPTVELGVDETASDETSQHPPPAGETG
jgi:hypothetical protein